MIYRGEKKKFKKLQREVDKMAALMKDDDDEEGKDDEDAEEPEKEESEAEESESEESDSGESEGSDAETEESEPEVFSKPNFSLHFWAFHKLKEKYFQDAPDEKKKANYEPRIKCHEGRLAALKKGNLLRQANLDRLIDEINKLRDDSVTLQHDLDSVLSELG